MENTENEEINTTVEFCTLCTQYVFGYTFYPEQVLKKALNVS